MDEYMISTTQQERHQERHKVQDLVTLFNGLFQESQQTILVPGAGEPIYLPKQSGQCYHEIHSSHDYFASALHEIAHWCIAGQQRKQMVDFGYWYEPDGRTVRQQKLFEQVEAKPQALEWILSTAAGFRFQVSIDNLNGDASDSRPFKEAVFAQVLEYCDRGIPKAALQLCEALSNFYCGGDFLMWEMYSLEKC